MNYLKSNDRSWADFEIVQNQRPSLTPILELESELVNMKVINWDLNSDFFSWKQYWHCQSVGLIAIKKIS